MHTRDLIFPVLLMAWGLSACAIAPTVPFSDADFDGFSGRGTATLEGSALGRTNGGEAKTCAGNIVYLAPANPYDDQVVGKLALLSAADTFAGPAMKYWRQTACDAEGKFVFRNVPAQHWYVLTSIEYQVLGPTIGTTESQGGLLMRKLALSPGDNDVVLTTDDSHVGLPF